MTNNADTEIGLVAYTDQVQPFLLHKSQLRGRLTRLNKTINKILRQHENPALAKYVLGEMLTLASMLGGNLPEGGILSLQIQSNGPISFMIVDATQDGHLRGYINVTEEGAATLATLEKEHDLPSLKQLLGEGYLAITLDMGYGEPHQGIVPLEGDSLTKAVEHYFSQSQQMDVIFKLVLNRQQTEDTTEEQWSAAGIMLERIPEEGGKKTEETAPEESELKGWDYNALLIGTVTEEELLDPHLAPSALLYRLFNEGGVWVYDPHPILAKCRCSREKITETLASLALESLEELKIDGIITVNCQFCNTTETFTEQEIAAFHPKTQKRPKKKKSN